MNISIASLAMKKSIIAIFLIVIVAIVTHLPDVEASNDYVSASVTSGSRLENTHLNVQSTGISRTIVANVVNEIELSFTVPDVDDDATHHSLITIPNFTGKIGEVCSVDKVVYASVSFEDDVYKVSYYPIAVTAAGASGTSTFNCKMTIVSPSAGTYEMSTLAQTATEPVVDTLAVIAPVVQINALPLDPNEDYITSHFSVKGFNGAAIPSGTALTVTGVTLYATNTPTHMQCLPATAAPTAFVSVSMTYTAASATIAFTADADYRGCVVRDDGSGSLVTVAVAGARPTHRRRSGRSIQRRALLSCAQYAQHLRPPHHAAPRRPLRRRIHLLLRPHHPQQPQAGLPLRRSTSSL
jgi:hypothetical protein